MTLEEMIAAYEADGGEVTRVAPGERAITDTRRIYTAMREGRRAAADEAVATRAAEDRAEAEAEAFRAAKYDGASDADALAYAQSAK